MPCPPPRVGMATRRGLPFTIPRRFSHPYVRSRLERLMGSNITRITDRRYMQRLAERIQEDYEDQLLHRIKEREEAEVEREKRLILEGKIPVEQVPEELADHPVFKISRQTSSVIEARRSKVAKASLRKSYLPTAQSIALRKSLFGSSIGMGDMDEMDEKEDMDERDEEEIRVTERQSMDERGSGREPSLVDDVVQELLDETSCYASLKETVSEVVDKAVDVAEGIEQPYSYKSGISWNADTGSYEEGPKKSVKSHVTISIQEEAFSTSKTILEMVTQKAMEEAGTSKKQYMLSPSEFRRLKYELPMIETLRTMETVDDLYDLAEEIVGNLWIGQAERPSFLREQARRGGH